MPEATATATTARLSPPPDPRRASGAEAAALAAEAGAAAMVDALVVAWTMFRVYHDPRNQDAFRRAVTTLSQAPALPWIVEVHGGGFRHHGRPVPTRRQATPALARAAFARGIAALGFSSPPTADDLVRLFEVLSFQEAPGGPPLDAAAALAAAGATRLIVVEHGRLVDAPEGLEEAEELVPAEPGLEVAAGGARRQDPARRYLDEYRLLYERLQAGDFQGLQELVHEFTDSFFSLPREQQIHLFEQFLTHHEEEPFRLLLDQFSQDDLAELAQMLSPGTHPLLVDYARIAAQQESQGAPPGEMLTAEQLVSDRISRMLGAGRNELRRQVGEALRAQIPGPQGHFRAGVGAAAAVFALADDEGFAPLARTVAAKCATALDEGDLTRAARWGQVLLAAAPSPARKEVVRRQMEAALRPEILDRAVPAVAAHDPPPAAVLALLTLFALNPLIERLAAEENSCQRRSLVGLLTAMARARPGPLLRRLGDPRWYLVRNLVEILGHSGRPEAAPGLRAVCTHPDHRVRREALRALPAIDRREAAAAAVEALQDPEPAIRTQALGLLRTAPGPEVDAALTALVESRLPVEERLAAVAVLAGRATAAGRAGLRHLARRRLWASAAVRETRQAARRALSGGGR